MIRYYEGVEGSGKTCMMTRDLYRHKMYGGRVLSLPGYELFGRTQRSVLSEVIHPEQILEMLSTDDTKLIRDQKIVIAMDEVTSFFNNHDWHNKINDVLEILLQERRKFRIGVMMTGPEEERLPSNIRYMIHEMIHCRNLHSLHRDIPNDLYCVYYKEDRRGMLSHPRYKFTRKRQFNMKRWQKHFDTYAAVGYNLNTKYRIQKQEVVLGSDGKPIYKDDSQEEAVYDERVMIAAKVEELKALDIERIEIYEFASILDSMGLPNNKGTKDMFLSRGIYYDNPSQCYRVAPPSPLVEALR